MKNGNEIATVDVDGLVTKISDIIQFSGFLSFALMPFYTFIHRLLLEYSPNSVFTLHCAFYSRLVFYFDFIVSAKYKVIKS